MEWRVSDDDIGARPVEPQRVADDDAGEVDKREDGFDGSVGVSDELVSHPQRHPGDHRSELVDFDAVEM